MPSVKEQYLPPIFDDGDGGDGDDGDDDDGGDGDGDGDGDDDDCCLSARPAPNTASA